MARADIAFVQLLWELLNRKTGELGQVSFKAQKPPFDAKSPIEQAFPRATPESQGIDSAYLAELVQKLGNSPKAHMHQMLVLRHGHVIYEGGFCPYPFGVWHVTYSMCKSVTNMAVGLLIDEGKLHLEDHLVDLLGVNVLSLGFLKFRDITVRDLLTMSTGATFNEVGAITGDDWVKGYLESNLKFPHGTKFDYNSMNSFMLSAIVSRLTGQSMFEYLKPRLFAPLGITKVFWEESPMGITKGGWGLFLCAEDAAKLGQLYLQKGIWQGKQIISKAWVAESTRVQIETGQADNPQYGYHIWMDTREGSFTYNGMLGQNVHVYPDLEMVVVTNAGNSEVFQTGSMTDIIRTFFAPSYQPPEKLPENATAYAKLCSVRAQMEGRLTSKVQIRHGGWNTAKRGETRHLREAHYAERSICVAAPPEQPGEIPDFHAMDQSGKADTAAGKTIGALTLQQMEFLKKLDGTTYEMKQKGVGLFPLIMQVVHNNYTWGISALHFQLQGGRLYLKFKEGEHIHILPVGFDRPDNTAIDMNGEEYLVAVCGKLARNEDHCMVLSLQIAFVEEATERTLKIVFRDAKHLELHWSEKPGDTMILDTLEMITMGSGNVNLLVNTVMSQVSTEFIRLNVQGSIQPVVPAVLTCPDDQMPENQEVRSYLWGSSDETENQ